MSRSTVGGIIFDLDGTLIDSLDAYRSIFDELQRRFGSKPPKDDFERFFGRPIAAVLRDLIAEGRLPWWIWIHLLFNRRRIRRSIHERTSLFPDARECLSRFGAYPLAIATSMGSRTARQSLDRFEIAPFFKACVTRNDVTEGKPAPDSFLKAAAALNLPPDRCVVVEDSPIGIRAARAAGIPSIAVLTSTPGEHFTGDAAPDLILASLAELTPDRVESLRRSLPETRDTPVSP